MEWRMVAITQNRDKADIRQIVGRDSMSWRKTAAWQAAARHGLIPPTLMS